MWMYGVPEKSKELYHFGRKGQKWGVRRGPPYPIEDTVLRKGTRLNSVSSRPDSETYRTKNKWMYTYRPDEEWDTKVYKGAYASYLILRRGEKFVYEHKYETVRDLAMPNRKERMAEFKNLYDTPEHKEQFVQDLTAIRKKLISMNVGSAALRQKYMSVDLNNLQSDEEFDTAYSIFNHAMLNKDKYRSTKLYANNMEKKYDAMVDDNNQGVYNNAHDPIIVFKAEETLKALGNSQPLSMKDIHKNVDSVKEKLKKKGVQFYE